MKAAPSAAMQRIRASWRGPRARVRRNPPDRQNRRRRVVVEVNHVSTDSNVGCKRPARISLEVSGSILRFDFILELAVSAQASYIITHNLRNFAGVEREYSSGADHLPGRDSIHRNLEQRELPCHASQARQPRKFSGCSEGGARCRTAGLQMAPDDGILTITIIL
jgi:hypothetical protein